MKRCTALNYKFQPCTDSVLLAHAPTLQTPSTSTCTYNIMLPELQKQNTDTNFVTSNTHLSTITRKEKNMLKWAVPGNFFVWHLHCFTSTWLSRHSEWKERNNLVHQGLHSVSVLILPPPPPTLPWAWAVSNTSTPARTTRLGLCPALWHQQEHQCLGCVHQCLGCVQDQQEHQGLGCVQQIDTNKNTKAWAASNRLTPTRTPRLGLRPTDWHQQEHQGLGCVQQIDTNKNTKAWAVLTTHWYQQEHQGMGCVTTHWHQQEHHGLGCVPHLDTSMNTKSWAVSNMSTPFYIHRMPDRKQQCSWLSNVDF